MQLADVLLGVGLILCVRDPVDPGAGILSQTPNASYNFSTVHQVSDVSRNCRFGSSLASSDILSMSVHIMIRVLSLDYVSFQQIRTLASPSLQWSRGRSLRKPCGSHLHRYYEVVRLLSHPPCFLRSTLGCSISDPNQSVPPRCGRGWGALLGSRPASSDKHALG